MESLLDISYNNVIKLKAILKAKNNYTIFYFNYSKELMIQE